MKRLKVPTYINFFDGTYEQAFEVKGETYAAKIIKEPYNSEFIDFEIVNIKGIPKRHESHIRVTRDIYNPNIYKPPLGGDAMKWMEDQWGLTVSIKVSVKGCGIGKLLYQMAFWECRLNFFQDSDRPIGFICSDWALGEEYKGGQFSDQFKSFAKATGLNGPIYHELINFDKLGIATVETWESTNNINPMVALEAVKASFSYPMYNYWYSYVKIRHIYLHPFGVRVFFQV